MQNIIDDVKKTFKALAKRTRKKTQVENLGLLVLVLVFPGNYSEATSYGKRFSGIGHQSFLWEGTV